jgi:hypothetical protein
VYFDTCCQKRPFDGQSQPRIRLEAETMLALLGHRSRGLDLAMPAAHDLENSLNPVTSRAERVQEWLDAYPIAALDDRALELRTSELMDVGLAGFDALYLASAEAAGAEVFVTCDDRLLARARRLGAGLGVRVTDPVGLFTEVMV